MAHKREEINPFEEPNGSDIFKMSFGGEKKSYYNVAFLVSLQAKIAKRIGEK